MNAGIFLKGKDRCLTEYHLMTGGMKDMRKQYTNNYNIGKELANINGTAKIPTIAKSIVKNTKVTKKQVPALAALIGTFTPIPIGGPIGYVLARIIGKIL